MAATTIREDVNSKTMLIFKQGEGLTLAKFDLRAKRRTDMRIVPDDLQAIADRWPEFHQFLLNAGAQNVSPATPSRRAYKASSEQGSLHSSPDQGSLI